MIGENTLLHRLFLHWEHLDLVIVASAYDCVGTAPFEWGHASYVFEGCKRLHCFDISFLSFERALYLQVFPLPWLRITFPKMQVAALFRGRCHHLKCHRVLHQVWNTLALVHEALFGPPYHSDGFTIVGDLAEQELCGGSLRCWDEHVAPKCIRFKIKSTSDRFVHRGYLKKFGVFLIVKLQVTIHEATHVWLRFFVHKMCQGRYYRDPLILRWSVFGFWFF